tara:strand:- start:287 stop:550 length:264 start_codon:yes stop_codon:yes gene_type:complete
MPELLEGQYLELVAQLKDKYTEIEAKMCSIERLEKIMKKDLITAYGVVRLLDHLIDTNPIGYDNEIIVLVEMLRGVLSDCVDRHLLT